MQIWIAFLDVNKIIFGDNVMVVLVLVLYAYPIDPTIRTAELEFGTPIIVEDNVWIGGSATILPALQLEKCYCRCWCCGYKRRSCQHDCWGNPAKVIRKIDENDQQFWTEKQRQYQIAKKQL